ncbi:MAG: RnfABCDGE type electron transport complex subunit D [Defluviitaleaceae bacterium]|nr:RnfABCDGE type electron transport complex subunit D [Defluviitaleaceae bacterium]
MNFPLKPAPHTKVGNRHEDIVATVIKAALFVAVWAIYNRFMVFGIETAAHVALMILVACTASTIAHLGFHMAMDALEKKSFTSFKERIAPYKHKIRTGETVVTGLILALAMQPTAHLYVVAIVAIFAEIIGKLIYGGYGQNIFNPVAVGLIFNALTFGGTVLTVGYLPDIITQPTPLAALTTANWIMTPQELANYFANTGGIINMFLGTVPGSVGETSRLALLVALGYMCYKKVADWVTPIFYMGTVYVIMLVYGFIIGAGFWYPVAHLLTGGIVFGAVFLASDPITTPINRQGKVIFAVGLAMFTLLIRLTASPTEGVAFSILLMNMLTPLIDSKTANVTTENTNKKIRSSAIAFAIATVVVIGFTVLTQL